MQFGINHAMAQSTAIERLANDLQAQLNRLNTMEKHLRNEWEGPAAEAFYARISELRADFDSQRQQMEMLAATIRNTANQLQASNTG